MFSWLFSEALRIRNIEAMPSNVEGRQQFSHLEVYNQTVNFQGRTKVFPAWKNSGLLPLRSFFFFFLEATREDVPLKSEKKPKKEVEMGSMKPGPARKKHQVHPGWWKGSPSWMWAWRASQKAPGKSAPNEWNQWHTVGHLSAAGEER